jgi:hypothetical protein
VKGESSRLNSESDEAHIQPLLRDFGFGTIWHWSFRREIRRQAWDSQVFVEAIDLTNNEMSRHFECCSVAESQMGDGGSVRSPGEWRFDAVNVPARDKLRFFGIVPALDSCHCNLGSLLS